MKKVLISIGMIILFASANAQFQKGTVMIGGNIDIFGNKTTNTSNFKNSYLNIKPQIGWFINDRTQIGIGLGYESSSETYNGTFWPNDGYAIHSSGNQTIPLIHSNSYYFNPYVTRYLKIVDKFYLTTTLNAQAGWGNNYSSDYSFDLQFSITPGITYFLSKNLALSANIGQLYYRYNKVKSSGLNSSPDEKYNDYGMSISNQTLFLGIRYVFSKSKD